VTCSCCRLAPARLSGICGDCATAINREKSAARRAFARHAAEHPCAACAALLPGLGVQTRCHACQTRYDQMMRAAAARVAKSFTGDQEAAAIERRLAQLDRERRQRRQRMTLSVEDCWQQAGVSSVYGMGDAR